jgi:hypothetical protein
MNAIQTREGSRVRAKSTRRGLLLASGLAFAMALLGNPWSEARAGTCGKCSGIGRYWAGVRGWVKCDRCDGTGFITENRRTPDDPSWPMRIAAWAVKYDLPNQGESTNDLYGKVGPNLWERVLFVTPYSTGIQGVRTRYQLTETGQRGVDGSGPYLDLDDRPNNQVVRIRPGRMDIFRRAQQRWDNGVYVASPTVIISWR